MEELNNKQEIVRLVFKIENKGFLINLNETFESKLNGFDYFMTEGVVKEIHGAKGGFVCLFELGSRLFIPDSILLYVIEK